MNLGMGKRDATSNQRDAGNVLRDFSPAQRAVY